MRMMHRVGIILGLEGEAAARRVRRAVLRLRIVEPVAGVEMGTWSGYGDVERPSTRRVLGVKRVSRCRAAFESVDAEAVIVSARAAELFVDLGYKLAQLVHLAEIEGSSGDVEHLAGRHAVFAHGQVRVGVDADELVVDLPLSCPARLK